MKRFKMIKGDYLSTVTKYYRVTQLHIEKENKLTGVVWQDGGGRPRLSWDFNGKALYHDDDLDMTNIKIEEVKDEI